MSDDPDDDPEDEDGPWDGRVTLCISTQIGCAMGCVFCASGQAGLERGLGAGFSPPDILRDHVGRGDFGVKTGRGFLELSQAEANELVARRDRAYARLALLRQEVGI